MSIEIFEGRPSEKRTTREDSAYDLLDSLGVKYRRADHEEAQTMEACIEIDRALGVNLCKNLFLTNRQRTDFYLLLIPHDKPFKTKELSGQLGVSRLSFGGAEDMEALLGLLPGSVSVLGLMNDTEGKVQLLIDEDLYSCEFFGCHPLINTSSLCFTTKELFDTVIPALKHSPIKVKLIGE
jgi:Ala-tRNA(Pro) deacylase